MKIENLKMARKKHETYGSSEAEKAEVVEVVEQAPIVNVDPNQFGVPEKIASNVQSVFQPMLDKMVELEEEFNFVSGLDPSSDIAEAKAKDLLKKYVKVRTGTADIHKQQKAFYLAGGRFIDAWKNAQLFASQGKEEKLKAIVMYKENLEAERIKKLHEERLAMVERYLDEDEMTVNFGKMNDGAWDHYLAGKKKAWEEAQKAKEAAELAREKEEIRQAILAVRMPDVYRYEEYIEVFVDDWASLTNDEFNEIISVAKAAKESADEEAAKSKKEAEIAKKEIEEAQAKIAAAEAKAAAIEEATKNYVPAKPTPPCAAHDEDLTDKERMLRWIESMDLPVCPDYGSSVSIDIINKFGLFKKWAAGQVEEKYKK